jgi:hypothetical protein
VPAVVSSFADHVDAAALGPQDAIRIVTTESPGVLDQAFGIGGTVTTAIGTRREEIRSLAV